MRRTPYDRANHTARAQAILSKLALFLYFAKYRNMQKTRSTKPAAPAIATTEAANAFAALGSEQRLELVKILSRAGPQGMATGELGGLAGVYGSTLSHHLKVLTDAGLVGQMRQGRFIVCTALAYSLVHGLAQYLTENCCVSTPSS